MSILGGFIGSNKKQAVKDLSDGVVKVLICCGGGFSSSAMAKKVKNAIWEKHEEDRIYVDFQPFFLVDQVIDDFDVIMCCPHLQYHVEEYVKERMPLTPIYMIPPRMYGVMDIKDVYYDAVDIIEVFKKTGRNPTYFDGEEELHKIVRYRAHRRESAN